MFGILFIRGYNLYCLEFSEVYYCFRNLLGYFIFYWREIFFFDRIYRLIRRDDF